MIDATLEWNQRRTAAGWARFYQTWTHGCPPRRYARCAGFVQHLSGVLSLLSLACALGSVHFQGQGWSRPVYFSILISHTILAAAIVPMIIITLSRALRERFDRHRAIARWTYPLWMYVSVTGVVVYFMLYHLFAA